MVNNQFIDIFNTKKDRFNIIKQNKKLLKVKMGL
jgi:hypothetical protein